MERIQSAIQKARADRQRADVDGVASKSRSRLYSDGLLPPLEADPDLSRPAADLWAALPAFVPNGTALERQRVVAQQSGPWTAAFDVMRTKLLIEMRQKNWKRVAITSPGSGCGKTTLTLNLAFSLARQPDLTVMVVELDLRKPLMAKVLGLHPKHSLADVLVGRSEPDIFRYGTNLGFLLGAGPLRQSAELLQSAEIVGTIDALQAKYHPDIMLFDMPPMMLADDTIAFIDKVDCALLIGAAEKTTIAELDICEQELAARTKVIGLVLNKCRYLDRSDGYGYGDY